MSYPVSKSKTKQLRKTRSDKNMKGFKPQLTSLIDVMTILLIYLLKSFSAEGEIVSATKNLTLPESSAQKKPVLTVVIAVNNEYIMAENEVLVSVDAVLSNDNLEIIELKNWLSKRKMMTKKIEQYSTKTSFLGNVTIQADKKIRFKLLKKIMYTCGQEEYNNFSLAVQKRGE